MSARQSLRALDGGVKATPVPSLRGAEPAERVAGPNGAGPTDAGRQFVRDALGSAAAAPLGDRILGRLTTRAARHHVAESHRLLDDIARSAIAVRALRRRVLTALRADGGLTVVVEWLRGRGYDVSPEALLAAWVVRRPPPDGPVSPRERGTHTYHRGV